jgi:hypothetical protein
MVTPKALKVAKPSPVKRVLVQSEAHDDEVLQN